MPFASGWRLRAEIVVLDAWLRQRRRKAQALREAERLAREADRKQELLLMRRVVALLVRHGDAPERENALLELEVLDDRFRLGELDVPDLGGPLPGEKGWDKRRVRESTQEVDQLNDLISAIQWDDAAAVADLIESGILENQRASVGKVLLEALRYDHRNLLHPVLNSLTSRLDISDPTDRLPLLACIAWGQAEVLQHLLGVSKTSPVAMNELLATAAEGAPGDVILALRACGADASALSGGQHPFVRAAQADNLSALIALSNSIDIGRVCNDDGKTALMAACSSPSDKQVAMRWLRDQGVPTDVKDSRGRTAWDYLRANRPFKKMVFRLQDTPDTLELNPTRPTEIPLYDAVRNDDIASVEDVLAYPRTEVNQRSTTGMTALQMAVRRGRLDMVDLLLAHPDITLSISTNYGRTSLHIAAQNRRLGIYARLIEDGRSNPDARTNKGQTPLDIARLTGDASLIRTVQKANAAWRPPTSRHRRRRRPGDGPE